MTVTCSGQRRHHLPLGLARGAHLGVQDQGRRLGGGHHNTRPVFGLTRTQGKFSDNMYVVVLKKGRQPVSRTLHPQQEQYIFFSSPLYHRPDNVHECLQSIVREYK